jgi:hypothetical protein
LCNLNRKNGKMVQCTFAEHQNPEKSINLDFETNCRDPVPNNIICFERKGSLLSPMEKLTKTFPKYIRSVRLLIQYQILSGDHFPK